MHLIKFFAVFLTLIATATYAETPSEPVPLSSRTVPGVTYFASCKGGDYKYELWVQLPKTLTKATLIYTHKKKELLSVPIAVSEYSKEDVLKIRSSINDTDFFDDGFYGFHFVISDKISSESKILVTTADGSTEYILDPIQKMYCVYRP